jgi:hypothetical protein
MIRTSIFLVAGLVLGASNAQTAQCWYATDNSASTGTCNLIPFGTTPTDPTWSNQKYQQLVAASTIGTTPTVISEIGFAPCGTGLHEFATLKITMDQTTNVPLSTTFASNLSAAAVVVLDTKNYRWNKVANTWNKIGLQKSYLFVPQRGDIVVDIEVTAVGGAGSAGFHRSGTMQRVYAFGWTGTPPLTGSTDQAAQKIELCTNTGDLQAFGLGCRGSNQQVPTLSYSGTPRIGTLFNTDLSNGPATRPAFLAVGASSGLPFPIDMTSAGYTGCTIYTWFDWPPIILATSASGTASVPIAIPNSNSLLNLRLYQQFICFDPGANPGNGTSSNYGRLLIGL